MPPLKCAQRAHIAIRRATGRHAMGPGDAAMTCAKATRQTDRNSKASETAYLAPRTSHLAPRTSHLAGRERAKIRSKSGRVGSRQQAQAPITHTHTQTHTHTRAGGEKY